jgi:hypothetical protein
MEWFLYLLTIARESRTARLEAGGRAIPPEDLILLPRNPAELDWLDACVAHGILAVEGDGVAIVGWDDFYRPAPSKTREAERERWRKRKQEANSGENENPATPQSLRSHSAPAPQAKSATPQATPHTEPNRTEPNHYHNHDQTAPVPPEVVQALSRLEVGGPSAGVLEEVRRYFGQPCSDAGLQQQWQQWQIRALLESIGEMSNAQSRASPVRCKPRVALKLARTKLAEWTNARKSETSSGIRMLN